MWDVASTTPITRSDVETAVPVVRAYLDEGFFDVRLGRTTPAQRRYMAAMADLGDGGPQASAAVAERLGVPANAVSPTRAELIDAALIYVPQRASVDFTVRHCADYIRRTYPLDSLDSAGKVGVCKIPRTHEGRPRAPVPRWVPGVRRPRGGRRWF